MKKDATTRRGLRKVVATVLAVFLLFGAVSESVPGLSLPLFTAHAAEVLYSGECGEDGDNLTWTLDSEGTLTISGTGKTFYWESSLDVPWREYITEYEYHYDLKKIVLAEGVEEIQSSVTFFDCHPEEVYISSTVAYIPEGINGYNLKSYEISENHPLFCDVDGVLFSKDKSTLISYPKNRPGSSYTIPASVSELEANAFSSSQHLVSIDYAEGASFTHVPADAFSGNMLECVYLPATVTYIEGGAFDSAYYLTEINIAPENEKYCTIDGMVFNKSGTELVVCPSGLEICKLGAAVTAIDENAFYWLSSLKEFVVDSGNTVYSAANGCLLNKAGTEILNIPSEIGDLVIPKTVTSIPDETIENAGYEVTSLTVEEGNAAFVAKNNVLMDKAEKTVFFSVGTKIDLPATITHVKKWGLYRPYYVCYAGTTAQWESVTFDHNRRPDMVICSDTADISGSCGDNVRWTLNNKGELRISGTGEMGYADYDRYKFFVKKIIVEEGVTSICNSAFERMEYAEELVLPDSLEVIWAGAFSETAISSITIPKNVKEIWYDTAWGCKNLTEIKIDENNKNFFVKDGCLYTSDCSRIVMYPVGELREYFVVPMSVTDNYISGLFYNGSATPYDYRSVGQIFKETENNTAMLIYTFTKDLKIPSKVDGLTVTKIKDYAMSDKTRVTVLDMPEGMTEVGIFAFNHNLKLTEVYVPSTMTTIGAAAFKDCVNLTDVYYAGSEEDWAKISIGEKNEWLTGANIHFGETKTASGVTAVIYRGELNIDSKTELCVEDVTDAPEIESGIISVLDGLGTGHKLFDISFLKDGKEVQPSAPLTVKIPVPAGYDAESCEVYHVLDDGTVENMNAVVDGGYLVFTAKSFSLYAVVNDQERLPGDINSDGTVDMKDSTVLRRWLAGWDVTINESNADVNGDGEVNLLDSTILRRHLANWQGVELV